MSHFINENSNVTPGKYTLASLAVCVKSAKESVICIIKIPNVNITMGLYNPVWAGLYQDILVTPLVVLLFPVWLSGGNRGTENRKEPQGLCELVRTQRVHDVIRGSGTAVLHCVIVYSVAHLCPVFWCWWEGARSQACLLPCWWIPF